MTNLQGECSYKRADLARRFYVGRVHVEIKHLDRHRSMMYLKGECTLQTRGMGSSIQGWWSECCQ